MDVTTMLRAPQFRRRLLYVGLPGALVLFLIVAALPPLGCRTDETLLSTLDWEAPACSRHGRLLQSLYPLGNRDFRLGALTHEDQDFARAKDLARRELMREAAGAPGEPGSETALMAEALADEWKSATVEDAERARRLALYAAFARIVALTHAGRRDRAEEVGAGVRLEELGLSGRRHGPVPPAAPVFCFTVEDVGTLPVAAVMASPRLARCIAARTQQAAPAAPATLAPALPASPRAEAVGPG